MIKSKLDKIKDRISDPSFLANKGLSNEVGIHVFCYDPKDEIVVQDYIARLKNEANTPYRIIECDLYEIFLATVYKGNIIKNLIMDCQSYTKYRPNETTGGIFVSWRRKEELPTGLD